ncbi:hypothetical protein OSB04_012305 [Centaurea solstitialis]|uniref:Uncharacterized protein n=1 Tax=Centaurea solstitialis TaxID=347529 RepID=A0AA38WQL2_9ASTR|nr:hypothetical protein OSB04_012305 [Centaurea solstitialis]
MVNTTSNLKRGGGGGGGGVFVKLFSNIERIIPGHWDRTRYRGLQQNRSSLGPRLAKETSLLFYNFPRDWGVTQLWRLFKRYGTVSDIYMAFKRLRNGERFGFVRFRGVQNDQLLEGKLKKIWIGEANLKVHLANKRERRSDYRSVAKYPRYEVGRMPTRSSQEENRSYAEVVKKGLMVENNLKNLNSIKEPADKSDLKGPNLGCWEAEAGDLEYLNQCAVGSVSRMEHVDSIQALISAGTLENCEIKMLGGRDILIKFDSKETAENIIQNKVHGLHFWAKELTGWSKGFRASNRMVWLRILGVPLHIWKVEVFKDIATNWGSVVTTSNCDLKSSPNLMWGKVLINTSLKTTINEIKSVKVGGLFYVIKVEEEDGVGLEGQIRSYHQQVQRVSDEDRECSSDCSEWSEDVGSEEESAVKEGFVQEGKEGRQSSPVSRTGSSSQVHSVAGEGDGRGRLNHGTVAGERLEAEKSPELDNVMMRSPGRSVSSNELFSENKVGDSLGGSDSSSGSGGFMKHGCNIEGGPQEESIIGGPNQEGKGELGLKNCSLLEVEPNSSIPAPTKDMEQNLIPQSDGKVYISVKEQVKNPETMQKRKEEVSQSKGKIRTGGGMQKNKPRQPDNIAFGRGRVSLHYFKKLARANPKKSLKSRQLKRKPNTSGEAISSDNLVAISSELKGDGLSENIEEFGSEIGETKLKEVPIQLVNSLWGVNDVDFDCVEAIGNSGGLLSMWNKNIFQGQFVIKDRFFIAIVGKWVKKEGLIGCVNVYGPNEQRERAALWSKLDLLCAKEEVSWCFFGDFNEVRNPQERLNSVASKRGMEDFNEFIRRNMLEEVTLGESKFTRFSDDGTKFSKLDRFLVTRSFGDRWSNLCAKPLERKWSDHTPILLSDKVHDFGPKPFKFFDIWLKEETVVDLVKKVWQDNTKSSRPDCIFRDKLKRVKTALKEWRSSGWGDLDKKVNSAKEEVRKWEAKGDVSLLVDSDRDKWLDARNVWRELEEKSIAMSRQRAKLKWAKEGDENSKLFHTACKFRERRNHIQGLSIHGTWSENPDEIKRKQFKKISGEEAKKLENKFSEEEVWSALNDCGCNKSPGPDGFTTGFLKKFWDIIKKDFLAVMNWFWEKEAISDGCNSSFVTLVPKVTNPIGLNEFRPISLVGVLYKVISKVLADRMKAVMGSIISDVQSAFLKGRSILDGVLIANEAVNYLKGTKRKALIFKVDFEKAYDSVNWEFLLDVLEFMGFGLKWRNWIRSCLKTSKISILVNGSPTDEFRMEKGLRQGDPLAPFLFLVVAEGLHVLVEEAKEKGLLKGLKVGEKEVILSHLQYADDAIFFGEWEAENIVNVIKILKCFNAVSGLKVNLDKCSIFGIGVPEQEVVDWARVIGCGKGTLPLFYLGLPVGSSIKRLSHWEKVVNKFKSKLSGWKSKWLSFGGRLTLVKSVLSSIPYTIFRYFMPRKETRRGSAWVKWDKVLESFEEGGLNVGGLREMNWCLIGKWWWRFFQESGALWRKIIVSLYGENGGLEVGGAVGEVRGSSVWKSVIKVGKVLDREGCNFSTSFEKEVGDGWSTKFWEDIWVGGETLKGRFNRLYNLETCKEALIAERGSFIGNGWVWEWSWRRELRGREVGEFSELCSILEGFNSKQGEADKYVWKLDPAGGFSVKTLRSVLGERRSGLRGGARRDPTRWDKSVPAKVNVFFWRASLGRLPCRAELDKRGVDMDSVLCPRCNREIETVTHALFSCDKVKAFWTLVGRWWNLEVSNSESLQDLLLTAVRIKSNSKGTTRWEATIRCLTYLIWENRNKMIFNLDKGSLVDNFFAFQRRIFEWIANRNKAVQIGWISWLSDPLNS